MNKPTTQEIRELLNEWKGSRCNMSELMREFYDAATILLKRLEVLEAENETIKENCLGLADDRAELESQIIYCDDCGGYMVLDDGKHPRCPHCYVLDLRQQLAEIVALYFDYCDSEAFDDAMCKLSNNQHGEGL